MTADHTRPIGIDSKPIVAARLLGRFSVTVDGHLVDTTSSRRTRNLLAYLLTHRQGFVPRDVLMEVFWPQASFDAARNSLHVALTRVRRALGMAYEHPILRRQHDTYSISSHVQVWTDVAEFERACRDGHRAERVGDVAAAVAAYEHASDLYEGDFLAEDPYAEWAAAQRDALRLQVVEARSQLVDLYLKCRDYGHATRTARAVLRLDPCNEGVTRQLIASYAGSGQVHRALAQYHQCVNALWEHFRVRPSRETVEMCERLRAQANGGLGRSVAGTVPDHDQVPPAASHIQSGRPAVRV